MLNLMRRLSWRRRDPIDEEFARRLDSLPVGWSMMLPDRGKDDSGVLVVRCSTYGLVFYRIGPAAQEEL